MSSHACSAIATPRAAADHQLELPLRERNSLLLAAGYAPVYPETALDTPQMTAVLGAVRHILAAHQPNPAVVIDRWWNLVDANSSVAIFTEGLPGFLLAPPINVLRATLHPEGLAPRIANLGQWRAHLLSRLRREAARSADAQLSRLYDEVRAYPSSPPDRDV